MDGPEDEHAAAGRSPFFLDVEERLEDEYRDAHMRHLRFFIGVWHCCLQQRDHELPNTAEDNDEFEMEMQNFFDLLMNPRLRSVDVLHTARVSLSRYVDAWSEANGAIERWWSPRRDKETAMRTDIQLVSPGIWIGSTLAAENSNQAVFHALKIRHVVRCSSSKPEGDDDFEHGEARALESLDDEVHTLPIIESDKSGSIGMHEIRLHEVGYMEFLVRRRGNRLSKRSNQSWTTICHFLHELIHQPNHGIGRYIDRFGGVLLCCDKGMFTSVSVCIALLMTELWLPYDVALRLINCARLYVAPTEFFEHQLREYEQYLISQRTNMEIPVFTRSIS